METERRHRWSRSPVLGKDGKPVTALITPRREKLLSFILRNQPTNINEMHAYLGGCKRALYDALNVLVAQNNSYVRFAAHTVKDKNRFKKDAYELDTAGISYLSRKGELITKRASTYNFDHAKLASHFTTSIETGIERTENARLISWSEILKSERIPEKTREEQLAGIPTTYTTPDGEVFEKIVYADSRPFGIELIIDGSRRVRFSPGVEADMGTEPITTADFYRTSLYSKFLAYLSIEKNEIYRTHFGFPNSYVPFLFNDPARLKTAKAVLESLGGSKSICFKVARENAEPGYLFFESWERANHAPINFAC